MTPRTVRRLWQGLLFLAATAAAFYLLQNSGRIPGGGIALPKVLWLGFALYYWFLIPLFLMRDEALPASARAAFRLFFFNMLVRAVIELWMMYVTLNWHPWYGIAHDAFSIVLLAVLMLGHVRHGRAARLLFAVMPVMAIMFVIEIGFVLYLLEHVADAGRPVYYVPAEGRHAGVLAVTWLVVILLAAHTLWLLGKKRDGIAEC